MPHTAASANSSRAATPDPALAAVVVARTLLHYSDGADARVDRPAHIRAASSLARVPGGIALVQDDANFLAVVEPGGARVRAVTLPAGDAGLRQFDDLRGNKAHKLDLEACVAIEHEGRALLVAFGSGSTARREFIALVDGWETGATVVELVHAPRLYAELRGAEAFAGSDLNVEGAICLGDRVRLFGRGNGARRDRGTPANATCDLDWMTLHAYLRAPTVAPAPLPTGIVRYELGVLAGVPLGFTDATVLGDLVLFSAAAEASPDATRDGRVTGSALGMIGVEGRTRWAALTEPSGSPFAGKIEGIVPLEGDARRLLTVMDADDALVASALCTVELRGDWRA